MSESVTDRTDEQYGEDSEELAIDAVFDALNSSRRRFAVCYLDGRTGWIELDDLAAELASWETGTPREEITDTQTRRVYISLYQTHVPKLQQYGVVDYDADARTVRLQPRAEQILVHLRDDGSDAGGESTTRWWRYYLSVGAGGLVLIAGLAPVSSEASAVVGGTVAVAVAGLALLERRTAPTSADTTASELCDPAVLDGPEDEDDE